VLDAGDLKAFDRVCLNLGDITGFHSAPFSSEETKVSHNSRFASKRSYLNR
jgi:hypothetical protein